MNSVKFGMKDAVIYDQDKNRSTTSDQVRFNGEISLAEINVKGVLDYNATKMNEISLITSIGKVNTSIKVEIGLNEEIDLDDFRNLINGGNSIDAGIVSLSGVDMHNTIVLGSISYDLLTSVPIPRSNDFAKLPLAVVIMLTVDVKGNINATLSTEFNYSANLKRGISIINKGQNKTVLDANSSYEAEEFMVYEFNTLKTNQDMEFVLAGDAKGNLGLSIGPEVALMISGIMPIKVKAHASINADAQMQSAKVMCKNGTWTAEGPKASCNLSLETMVALGIRMIFEFKGIPFVEYKNGFDYNWQEENLLWKYNASSNDFTDKITAILSGNIDNQIAVVGMPNKITDYEGTQLDLESAKKSKKTFISFYDWFSTMSDLEGDIINYFGIREDAGMSFFGIDFTMSGEEISQILGTPTSQGVDEESGEILQTYRIDDYELYIYFTNEFYTDISYIEIYNKAN